MSVTDRLEEIEANALAAHDELVKLCASDVLFAVALGNVHYLLSLVRTQAAEIERLRAVAKAADGYVKAVEMFEGLSSKDVRWWVDEFRAVLARLEEQT